MRAPIQVEYFTGALYMLLDETFDNVQGYFLDKGTSLFETLATISAEEASIPVGGKCATLAAQVKHVAFYLDVLERNVRTGTLSRLGRAHHERSYPGRVGNTENRSAREL